MQQEHLKMSKQQTSPPDANTSQDRHRRSQQPLGGSGNSDANFPCDGPEIAAASAFRRPINTTSFSRDDYTDGNDEGKTRGGAGCGGASSDSGKRGKKSSASSGTNNTLLQGSSSNNPVPAMASLQASSNENTIDFKETPFIQFDEDDIVINVGGKSTQTKKVQDFGDISSFKSAQSSMVKGGGGPQEGLERSKQGPSGAKKQGITHQNMQNMINTEGPMIVAPADLIGGSGCATNLIARTNPTSMRDKIKVDNPGKKILTPRSGQKQSQSAHTSNMNTNSTKTQQQLLQQQLPQHHQHQHQEIDAYSSEKVSQRGGTAPVSIKKHHESISGVSSNTVTKTKGKKYMTSLTDIEKKHLGMTSVLSKKNFSGSKNCAGRGTSGSIDLQGGGIASMNVLKTKSIHGQKVSEVTVQANHKKSQPPSFTSSMSSKQFASGAKSGSLLSGIVMTPQKFRVKNTTQSGKKGSILKSQQANQGATDKNNNQQQQQNDNPDQKQRPSSKSQVTSTEQHQQNVTGGRQGLCANQLLQKVTSEKKLTATVVGTTLNDTNRLSPRDTTEKGSRHRLSTTSKKGTAQKNPIHIQMIQPSYMNEYLAKSQMNMKQLQHVKDSNSMGQEPVQLMSTTVLPHSQLIHSHDTLAIQKSGAGTGLHMQHTAKANYDTHDQKKKPSMRYRATGASGVVSEGVDLQRGLVSTTTNAPSNNRLSKKSTNVRRSNGGGSHIETTNPKGEEKMKKGRSIDDPVKSYNRFELESISARNQSVVTDQITMGGQQIKDGASSGLEKNLFYKVQDSTLNQEDLTDQDTEGYLEEHDFPHPSTSNQPSISIYGDHQHQPRTVVHDCSDMVVQGGDDGEDGVPIVDEVEDNAFNKTCTPNQQIDGGDDAIDHRNGDGTSAFNINVLDGQKTELFDRKRGKMRKKKGNERGPQVKSHLQPFSQPNEIDSFIYNARSGGPNQNFNFAKNSYTVQQTRPTSTKYSGSGQKNCQNNWTGNLVQASYTSAKLLHGQPSTTKNQHVRGATMTFNSSFQKHVAQNASQQAIGSQSAQKGHTGSSKLQGIHTLQKDSNHMASKDVFKNATAVSASSSKKKSGGVQQPTMIVEATQQQITSSSFEKQPGSQSMSYIPPRCIQDQSLQLIQVPPLSRAELNNQSAYHLADSSQYRAGADSSSHLHKSISYSKDDTNAFSRSIQQKDTSSPGKTINARQRAEYQTITSVQGTTQQSFKGTQMAPGATINSQGGTAAAGKEASTFVFNRSQSNQQIVPQATVDSKRQSDSQSRGQTRENSTRTLIASQQPVQQPAGGTGQKKLQQVGKSQQPLTTKHSYQASKLARKNQNNLKMQTMQLRDQDFKKITSQIQSQTVSNAKKKKLQFNSNATLVSGQKQGGGVVGAGSNAGQQVQSRLNKPQGSLGQDTMDLNTKFMKTSKIYSPHRRSIQQVPNSNMVAYLNQIDGTTGPISEQEGLNGQFSSRKFAYSLTDKYMGGLVDEVWKQPAGVYAGSHVSSSDGGASFMIPSENERIAESSSKQTNKASLKGKKSKKHGGGMTNSQGNLPKTIYQSGNIGGMNGGVNMFFPDPNNNNCFEMKKQSLEKASGVGHPTASLQNLTKSRGSSKHRETHRIVKVTKPFTGNTFNVNKGGSRKVSPLVDQKKQLQDQAKPNCLISESQNLQKKAGSFGGGFQEPQQMTIQMQSNSNKGSFTSQQKSTSKYGGKNDRFASNGVPSATIVDSGCHSPEQQPTRKKVHLNSQGPGSLIANANLIRPIETSSKPSTTKSVKQIDSGENGLQGALKQAQQTTHLESHVAISAHSAKNSLIHSQLINPNNALKMSFIQQSHKKVVQKKQGEAEWQKSSPSKKGNKKLSHKIQTAGYTVELSTATKKVNLASNSIEAAAAPSKESKTTYQSKDAQHHKWNLAKNASSTTPIGLQLQLQSTENQKSQNIQLLRQVHHKQITTASKGKDSGSVQQATSATGQGKSVSVLLPSTESVAQSKSNLFDHQAHIVTTLKNSPGKKLQSSFAYSAEKERRSGGSLVVNHDTGAKSEKFTPLTNKESAATTTTKAQPPLQPLQNIDSSEEEEEEEEGQASESNDATLVDPQSSSRKTSFISQKYNNTQQQKALNVIEERLESQESVISDPTLSPRSRQILKIQKKIRFSFMKGGVPPETQTENYKIGKVMGKGAFGKVNLAIHRLATKFVALKSINKQFLTQAESKRKVMQEFNILRRTRHCNIVRLYESFETQQHIVFVMEVCGGGDLLTYVRRRRKLKEDVARFLFKQIITGLAYCHTKSVLHRDIKLDNILLTSQGDVKICDFGVSKLVTPGETMNEQCGTPAYIAPEVFKNEGYEGFASDIWSAGVVLYAMLFGAVPFKAINMTELHKQVLERQPTYKEEEISQEALSLLKGILEKDPALRLTSDQILKHHWMQAKCKKAVKVFSDSEKEGIVSEFDYYNKRERDVIVDGEHQVVPTDPFAEQMLSSTQNSELKNVSTRSIILAPFNSTRSQLDYTEDKKMIKAMMAPRQAVKFSAKVKEIDRQYELNNNADLDNGVYHQDEDEEAKEESHATSIKKDNELSPRMAAGPRPTEERPETRVRTRAVDDASIADSFNQEHLQSQLDELDESKHSINSAELDEGGNVFVSPATNIETANDAVPAGPGKQLSEWRLLEKQMIKGDFGDKGSPPKQRAPGQRVFEELKGDKVSPESGDLGHEMLDQSYEQVQIELYDDVSPDSGLAADDALLTVGGVFKGATAAGIGASNVQRLTLVVEEASVMEIEKSGYPKSYIMASLNNDDLNHVTTFYYLLQTQKEY